MNHSLSASMLPPNAQRVDLDDFSGGLFTTWPDDKIPLNYSPNLRNVFIDKNKIETIKGYDTAGGTTTLSSVNGIFPFYSEDGNKSFLVSDSSVVLDTSDFSSYVLVSSGLNSAALLRCIQVRNKMWCGNGVDSIFTWDRTTKVNLDGTNGTPNVPKFRYMDYWLNRVWGLNTAANRSSLNWSLPVISTSGLQLAPDDSRAWPSDNQLNVGRGDGQDGTALYVENGRLKAGKESSIYTIFGNNDSSFEDSKTEPNIGINSIDSIVNLDRTIYFNNPYGFYGGYNRISDLIIPDIEKIQNESSEINQIRWDTQSDFLKGTFNGTTVTASGFLTLIEENQNYVPSSTSVPTGSVALNSGSTYYGFVLLTFSDSHVNPGFKGYLTKVTVSASSFDSPDIRMTVQNMNTGNWQYSTEGSGIDSKPTVFPFPSSMAFTGYELIQSSFAIRFELLHSTNTYTINKASLWTINFTPSLDGQFTSDIATVTTTISAWGNFDTTEDKQNSSINYFYRTSTAILNISNGAWRPISSGAKIDTTTDNTYIQWATTITAVSTSPVAPSIDLVTVNTIEGAGAFDRPFGIDWNNRYWLAVATESSGNFSVIYVKSLNTNKNPNAWMPIYGINIRSFAKDKNNVLYAGAASSGTIYRLDYGDTFDGTAIESIYETPTLTMDFPYKNKKIMKYLIQGDKEVGANIIIETSLEESDFVEKIVSISGTGNYKEVIEGLFNDSTNEGKTLKVRLKNNQINKGLSVHDFHVIWTPTDVYK